MTTRRKKVQEIQLSPQTLIEIEVSYHDGSLWQKGYSLHCQLISRTTTAGVTYRIMTGGEGIRQLIEPAARFNQKRLEILAESAPQNPRFAEMVEYCREIFARKQVTT